MFLFLESEFLFLAHLIRIRTRTSLIPLSQPPHLVLILLNHEKLSVFEIRNFTMERNLSGIIISLKSALGDRM